MRVRRKMGVEEGGAKRPPPPRLPFFPAYQASPPSRGCPSTSGCVMEIGKKSKKHWSRRHFFGLICTNGGVTISGVVLGETDLYGIRYSWKLPIPADI